MRKHIANCFTLLNLVFGSMAVIQILEGFADGATEQDLVARMCTASLLICMAGVVDFLDGLIARLLGVTSEMGKQLDSLADLVSFGLAPALIVFQFLKLSYLHQAPDQVISSWYLLPALLLPCAGAYRLARFNLNSGHSLNFEGLPIPAGGILIASFPLIAHFNQIEGVQNLLNTPAFWYILILIVGLLMVCSLPIMSMKFKNLSLKQNWPKFLLFILAVIGAITLQWLAIPIIFLVYILLSLLLIKKS